MQEDLTNILNFFWDLTDTPTGKRTILIYPMSIKTDGYQVAPSTYYPDVDTSLNEWISQRAIVLEPGKTDPMRAGLIIANLLVDNNLLVVKTPGMAFDEHLVAVDYAGVVDSFLVNDMKWSDSKEWISLNLKWNTRFILNYLVTMSSTNGFFRWKVNLIVTIKLC